LLQGLLRAGFEKLKRNFLIVAILLLSVITVLVLNRQRLQSKHRQQLALQQKTAAEAETAAAKEQLTLFTQNVIEKTALIETLRHQLQEQQLNSKQQELLEEASHQTILTDADWEKFKLLFERLHPGFFNRLREKTPGITLAELRMAALIRLHLTTKEMASILGISIDSVHKTRQRLRQRLHVATEASLEDSIARF
jgi:DNA-binding CsgD family transcriptional regulator